MKRILTFAASLLLAVPALAHEVKVGDLEIIHPNIPQPAASAKARPITAPERPAPTIKIGCLFNAPFPSFLPPPADFDTNYTVLA